MWKIRIFYFSGARNKYDSETTTQIIIVFLPISVEIIYRLCQTQHMSFLEIKKKPKPKKWISYVENYGVRIDLENTKIILLKYKLKLG